MIKGWTVKGFELTDDRYGLTDQVLIYGLDALKLYHWFGKVLKTNGPEDFHLQGH
ncbi:MAG: hypothetical protein AAFU74_14055 [Bacteroidota bacterium]